MLKSFCVLVALLFAAITVNVSPAAAACTKGMPCKTSTFKKATSKNGLFIPAKLEKKKRYASSTVGKKKYKRTARLSPVNKAERARVVAIIKKMAPRYGVPTWFALRIAKVESGYNPRARGGVGEIGVFQLKCATAKGIGYRGSCKGLYDAHANVQYGLKHLSLAIKSSRGNLKLAASKHNGGLGRKKLVKKYVNLVF
jgi:soluble lytic murein transglycosylase-like protein